MNAITSHAAGIAPETIFDCLGKPSDISARWDKMPRDSAILWPRERGGRIDYPGVVRLSGSGLYYWVLLRISTLEPVVGGLRFIPWDRSHPSSGQEPASDLETISAKISLALDGTHLDGCTERARIQIWPRLAKGKQVFEVILSPAKEVGR
jgi:hypothetical protein